MANQNDDGKLGTFLGVFTPTILTIIGVILYLRLGWLVGHMGLYQVILIVILANTITLITTLSFSSVATNTRVGVGGAYYIISRSLGLEIGGAIGLPLFLSQTFSVTLYAYGLAESIRFAWPDVPVREAVFVIVLLVGGLSIPGARFALKAQIPVMTGIVVSLLALAAGAIYHSWGNPLPIIPPTGDIPFWFGFAVFFPAVTGVMAGLGLSGDLRDSGRAIPRGAIAAVLTGFAVYFIVPFILIFGASPNDLRGDTLVWLKIAPFGPWLILPGLWGAIFSSAVGSMLGAPRTLQALAMDRLAPGFFGKRTGDWKELAPGMILSLVIALGAILLGNLNAVASVVTVFFLTTYGMVNIVAALESLSGDPSWRPKIRIPWYVNLAGGIACIAVIFLVSALAGIIAVVLELALWMVLSRRENQARWGDARRGIYETLIRWALFRLTVRPMHARNWRPHMFVFVSDPVNHLDLIRFGNWFSQGRGVVTACHLIVGDLFDEDIDVIAAQKNMQDMLDGEGLPVFAEVNVVKDVVEGITNVAQASGIAGIESNTILVGWPKDRELFADFLRVIRRMERLAKSFIIGRIRPRYIYPREGIERAIHVWWGGLQRNGDLMLLLAYLLRQNGEWRNSRIKIMSVASSELARSQTERNLARLIPEIRIQADIRVLIREKDKSIVQMIHEQSKGAEVVIFGLATPQEGKETDYVDRLEELAGDFPVVFFVKNSSLFIGELLSPTNNDNQSGRD